MSNTSQTVADDIVREEQEKLEKNLAAVAAVAISLQKEKRRNLDKKLENLAKDAMAKVDEKVWDIPALDSLQKILVESLSYRCFLSFGSTVQI